MRVGPVPAVSGRARPVSTRTTCSTSTTSASSRAASPRELKHPQRPRRVRRSRRQPAIAPVRRLARDADLPRDRGEALALREGAAHLLGLVGVERGAQLGERGQRVERLARGQRALELGEDASGGGSAGGQLAARVPNVHPDRRGRDVRARTSVR